jgi:acyl carrier protein
VGDMLLDSLDIIRLVSTLEDEFMVSIEGSDIIPKNFSSFTAIESLLLKCESR